MADCSHPNSKHSSSHGSKDPMGEHAISQAQRSAGSLGLLEAPFCAKRKNEPLTRLIHAIAAHC